nr:hypothetical protein [uncultured Arsenicibacter sp.]
MNVMPTSVNVSNPYSYTANLLRWQEPMAFSLRYRYNLPGQLANRMLNVELGLYVLSELMPYAPADSLPDLLNGEGAAFRSRPVWTPRQHSYLQRVRVLLAPYQNRLVWQSALQKYGTLSPEARLFSVNPFSGLNTEISSYSLRERLALLRRALLV